MSAQSTNAPHALIAIKSRFAEEFDDLTIVFVLHDSNNRKDALSLKRQEILAHPAGPDLFAHLNAHMDDLPEASCFGAMARTLAKKRFSFAKKDSYIAVIFLNKQDFITAKNAELKMRHEAYFHCWEVLALRDRCMNSALARQPSTTISRPLIGTEWLRKQMLADAFAAMILESTGEKNFVHTMLARRCEWCLSPAIRYNPEDFPFPLTLDATQLVYRDLHDAIPPRTGPLAHTKFMVYEISDIYDDLSLNQWVSFARAVQEMAWTGHNKTEILSAAIYACEDPHVRSMAYILAEMLQIDPAPLKDNNFYNPFDEFESNERAHARMGRETFYYALEKTEEEGNPEYLWKAASHANAKLLEGTPVGWCAQAMQDAYAAYCEQVGKQANPGQAAQAVFDESFQKIKWKEILRLHRTLIKARRQGHKITAQFVQELIKRDEVLSAHIKTFTP